MITETSTNAMNTLNTRRKTDSETWIPHLGVFFWLVYLGIAIWHHATNSFQPPMYDPIGYIQKAMNFWQAVEQGHFFNPLNLEPTARPPGTILMAYPFGFSDDFRGFHFRSVFVPIVCIVAAVYIAAGKHQSKAEGWWVGAIALLFSSLPLFYYFDWIEGNTGPVRWGLVDNFQAGIAAMAAAACVRSLINRSLSWLLFAAFFASFTLLIKPSGLMVMALVALTWIIIITREGLLVRKLRLQGASFHTYALKGGVWLFIVYIGVVVLCISSGYFSNSNFSFAKQALAIYSRIYHISFLQTLFLFHQSLGIALLVFIILVSLLFIQNLKPTQKIYNLLKNKVMGLLISSLAIFILGMWYWQFVQGGGNQIRYFFPFLTMGAVCVVPTALYIWPQASRLSRIFLVATCLLPSINIGLLLAAGNNPSVTWQKVSGVSVSVGQYREEVRQAYTFIDELRKNNKSLKMYSFGNGIYPAVFENVGLYEGTINSDLPIFHVILPMDWSRGFVVRVDELLQCNYILIRKYGKQEKVLDDEETDYFKREKKIFEVWLSKLNESSGIEVVSDGRVLRLLNIADNHLFKKTITRFVTTQTWRAEFLAANPPEYWNPDSVSAYTKNVLANEIEFGKLYKLHAIAINQINKQMKVEVWWEELRHEDENNFRFLFLHLLDSSGTIIGNQQIAVFPYTPQFDENRWRYGTVTFDRQYPIDKYRSLAFGIYRPPDDFLSADKGVMDWNRRRVLVPINAPRPAPG